jgi:hypothetical protein
MPRRVQSIRSSVKGQRPVVNTREPGELYVNFADLQLGVVNATKNPQDLVAVRYFSTASDYATGAHVVQAGVLYRARGPLMAGAFNAANWDMLAVPGDYEPPVSVGTVADYWRGDKSWVPLTRSSVGLGAVDNTSDASKPVSTLQQAAIDAKVTKTGDTMTGHLGLPIGPAAANAVRKDYVDVADGTLQGNINLKADIASPTFTGNPQAPTPTVGDNDTSIATTAFVTAAITAIGAIAPSNASPDMDGTAAAGSSVLYSRGDHVHPTDTSRVAKAGDTMTGDLTISKATPSIVIDKAAAGQTSQVLGSKGGLARWAIQLGNTTAEGGSNAGSAFQIDRYTDAGAYIATALQINRQTGVTTITSGAFGQPVSTSGGAVGTSISQGYIGTSTNTTAVTTHQVFYNSTAGGVAGYISTSGAATQYNASSDANLKEAKGNYDYLEAVRIIREDPVIAFTWKASGEDAIGWLAQKSYEVDPDLATKPADPTDGSTKPAFGEEGYQPWGIDYGRRTPYLWAALTHALDRIDQLEARIEALEVGPVLVAKAAPKKKGTSK